MNIIDLFSHIALRDFLEIISVLTAVTVAAVGWRITRHEGKETRDFQALVELREGLENKAESLEKEKERLESKVEQSNRDLEQCQKFLSEACAQSEKLSTRTVELEAIVEEQSMRLKVFEDQLLEARVMTSILLNQQEVIAKQFSIPKSVSEKTKAK